MTDTPKDIMRTLRLIEPTAEELRALGPEALPYLATLAAGEDGWLAGRAAYAAAIIGGAEGAAVVEVAARHPAAETRVAAAAAARNLRPAQAAPVLVRLLDDADVGVRKFALMSAPIKSERLMKKVAVVAEMDPSPYLRKLAARRMAEMPAPVDRPNP